MIAALLLAAVAPTAVDAELAFAGEAQRRGQWSAFRKWSGRDAVMFTPQAVWARDFLADRKDPAKSISWWPAQSFVSCDGRTAVNSGPWYTPKGKLAGYFTTVWLRGRQNWRWVYDGGMPAPLRKPVRSPAKVHRASCSPHAPGPPIAPLPRLTPKQARTTPEDHGRGESADRTLGWEWKVAPSGERTFRVFLWTKGHYSEVVHAVAPAP